MDWRKGLTTNVTVIVVVVLPRARSIAPLVSRPDRASSPLSRAGKPRSMMTVDNSVNSPAKTLHHPPPIRKNKPFCSHLLNYQYLLIYRIAYARPNLSPQPKSRLLPFLMPWLAKTSSPPHKREQARRWLFCCHSWTRCLARREPAQKRWFWLQRANWHCRSANNMSSCGAKSCLVRR